MLRSMILAGTILGLTASPLMAQSEPQATEPKPGATQPAAEAVQPAPEATQAAPDATKAMPETTTEATEALPETTQAEPKATTEATEAVPETTTEASEAAAPPAEKVITQQDDRQMLSKDLIGMKVLDREDKTIGEIESLLFDNEQRIVGGVVSVGGFLGIGAKSVALSWDVFDVRPEERVAYLDLTKEQLESAPAFRDLADIKAEEEAERMRQQQQQQMQQQPAPVQTQ